LIQKRGRDVRILDWLDELTADCPRKRSANISDQCHARCPDLPKMLFGRFGSTWNRVFSL
jgi:hypothetical protein